MLLSTLVQSSKKLETVSKIKVQTPDSPIPPLYTQLHLGNVKNNSSPSPSSPQVEKKIVPVKVLHKVETVTEPEVLPPQGPESSDSNSCDDVEIMEPLPSIMMPIGSSFFPLRPGHTRISSLPKSIPAHDEHELDHFGLPRKRSDGKKINLPSLSKLGETPPECVDFVEPLVKPIYPAPPVVKKGRTRSGENLTAPVHLLAPLKRPRDETGQEEREKPNIGDMMKNMTEMLFGKEK